MNTHPQWIIAYGYRNRNPRIVRWHDHSEIAKVTSETDAQLLASAPDLLAALKAATEQLSFLQRAALTEAGMSVYSEHIQEASKAIKAAREAITKAEA